MTTHGVVTSSNYLASVAGLEILMKGGNAFDAAAATGFAINVVEPNWCGIGGEAPIILYDSDEGKVHVVSGQGTAPAKMNVEWFVKNGLNLIPGDGLLPATVPSVVETWITVLKKWGTMSLHEVLGPAIRLASEGFPIDPPLQKAISEHADRLRNEWPSSAEVFLPGGKPPFVGELLKQPDLARMFRRLLDAEEKEYGRGRVAGLEAASREFYSGEIASKIADFVANTEVRDASGKKHRGFLEKSDLEGYRARVEEPVSATYDGYEVNKCGPWTQGPVFIQQLNILEGFDLSAMGHNTADYIHTLVETSKLAFADREQYYGDPLFDHVPLDILISKSYAETRRREIDPHRARLDISAGRLDVSTTSKAPTKHHGDTVHLDIIDAQGNMVAATPSGGWFWDSPVIPGLGFPLGTRAQMFYLEKGRNNCLQPGKRPRATLTPSLVRKDGLPYMVFGTAGGDMQDQWTLQFFLNHVVFGMGLQEAIDAPNFHSLHFSSSFYPRQAFPGRVVMEERIKEDVRNDLKARGHDTQLSGDWGMSQVCAAMIDHKKRCLRAGASPRRITGYAVGW